MHLTKKKKNKNELHILTFENCKCKHSPLHWLVIKKNNKQMQKKE